MARTKSANSRTSSRPPVRKPAQSSSTMASAAGVTRNNQLFTAENLPKLEDILQERYLYSKFKQFLDECLCVEYLLFYTDVLAYRQLTTLGERKKAYSHILKKYFWSESEYEINIPDHVKTVAIQQGRVPESLKADSLDATALEAQVVLNSDCLHRFFKCPLWLDYLENRPDSPEAARSRRKLAQFFGEAMTGPLKREELITVLKKKGFEKNAKVRAVTNQTESREDRRRYEMGTSYGKEEKNLDILRPTDDAEIAHLQRKAQKKMVYVFEDGLGEDEVVLSFKWSWKAMDYKPIKAKKGLYSPSVSPSTSFSSTSFTNSPHKR